MFCFLARVDLAFKRKISIENPRITLCFLCAVFFLPIANCQTLNAQAPDFRNWRNNPACVKWVDSVYNQLTPEECIGQFFMLAAYTQGKEYNMDSVVSLIKKGKAGGVIF